MLELHQYCAAVCSNVQEMTRQVKQWCEREALKKTLLLPLSKATKWAVHYQNPLKCTTDNKKERQREPAT
jgi:hypothetical protein